MSRVSNEPIPRRPAFDPEYGVPAELPDPLSPFAETRAKLSGARNYWISTGRVGGGGHAAPVWGLWLHDDPGGDEFWFSTDARSLKGRNIAANPDLSVHLESGDDVVIVNGSATRVPNDDQAIDHFIAQYEPKYDMTFERPVPEQFAFYRVMPTNVLVWLESDFIASAVRWEFP